MDNNKREIFLRELDSLQINNLQLSAHTIRGWRGQFDTMIRYFKRAMSANNSVEEFDFWITFFQNSYYLKDWLIETVRGGLDKKFKNRVEKLINNNEAMRVCADICNGTKHLRLQKNIRVDSYFIFIYEFNPFRGEEEREHDWKVELQDDKGRKRYKLSDLAEQCVAFWIDLIRAENL